MTVIVIQAIFQLNMYTGYLHRLDPFAIKLTENFGIRWYGLSYLAGFLICYLLVSWLTKRRKTELHLAEVGDFIFAVALGTVIGGRLGYCIFYSPELFLQVTSTPPFWGVLAINQGGMASHGGILGIIAACIIFGRRRKISILHLMDLCALCAGPGIFFGRLANFINGELVGREGPAWLSWGVRFPQDILTWPVYEPERLPSLGPVVEALGISREKWLSALTSPGSSAFIRNMLAQIVDAVRHGNLAVADALAPLLTLRHPSQIYEALLEGLLVFIILMIVWRRPRRPGVISGFFLVTYAAVRIVGEQFRMPDAHIGYQLLGLTRGQWLSIVMIIVSVALLIYWATRRAPLMGGWKTRGSPQSTS